MEVGSITLFEVILLFIGIDIILISLIFLNKLKHKLEKAKIEKMDQYIIEEVIHSTEKLPKIDKKLFINRLAALKEIFHFDLSRDGKENGPINKLGLEKYFIKRINSLIRYKRIEAIVYLGVIGQSASREALEKALNKERDYTTKLYIINSLSDIGQRQSICKIVNTIPDAPRWYREKVQLLLFEYDNLFYEYIPEIEKSNHSDIKELIIAFSSVHLADDLRDYLLKIINDPNEKQYIIHKAVDALANEYFTDLNNEKYLYHQDFYIRQAAVKSLAINQTKKNLYILLSMLSDDKLIKHVVKAIANIITEKSEYINILINKFNNETNEEIKKALATVISNRMDYLILKLSSNENELIKNVIKQIMIMGQNSGVINFLNRNHDIKIENELKYIVNEVLEENQNLKEEYCKYLNERVLEKFNLERIVNNQNEVNERKHIGERVFLYCLIFIAFLSFPTIYGIRHKELLLTMPFMEQIKGYVIEFNYYVSYYLIALSGIYIIILIFSFIGMIKQSKYWNLKKPSFLFKKGILPSISIIAPAFNEEATIIESANSLLNLKYPDYELIIVNDGSIDNTIDVLIDYFELYKTDMNVEEKLSTMRIRGIYINKLIPNLIVVDKENGGKADSLNTGINISSKDYFCGIDADSILETDALLKITSQMIDEKVECPAIGGNIFPINGCSVDNGMITDLKISKKNIERLQTIEYIRSFMAGRIGWAQIGCLLIISGAFGIFKKERIIQIGGYLSSSGKYKKDTVGEDMELVVRLSRYMIEKRRKYKILYAFNANCWTQVPDSYMILKKQRDRWHRGLIDIISFHKKLIGNIHYGRIGMIAFPYFFIFEMAGPLVEIQGYLMLVLAAIFGVLNGKMALLLLVATIFMGILISLASLLIAEIKTDYFKVNELMILILYSLIENFGPRQIMSLWRVQGFINSLRKSTGWGKMERKGFLNDNI